MNKVKLHNYLLYALWVLFPLSIVLALKGSKSGIYLYGLCFLIVLIMGKIKMEMKDE